MASGGTIQSVAGKISKDQVECSICCNCFKQPKLLDCLHSFCQKCLQDLSEHHGPNSTQLSCPQCKHKTSLKDKTISDLSDNNTLSALVEEFTMQELLLEGEGFKCQSCEKDQQAMSRCMDCDYFLCQECQLAHEEQSQMQFHKIYTLAQFRSGEIAYRSKLRDQVPKCKKHSDQDCSVYCNTCEKLVCLTCTMTNHEGHSFAGLPEALEKCKREIAELMAKAEKSSTELKLAVTEGIESRKELDLAYAETSAKIAQTAEAKIARLREQEFKMLQTVEKVYQDQLNTLDIMEASYSKDRQRQDRL